MTFWSDIFSNDNTLANRDDLRRRSMRLERRIRREQREVNELRDDLESRILGLEEHVGALTLMCRSMLQVLRSSDSWNEAEFARPLNEKNIEDCEHDDESSGDQENT
jgi:hypothetical protein